jgi:sec-independent protein translocase protein TatC
MPLRTPNEDLFESTRMSFGEHLEELRKVLIRALLGAAVGIVIGMLLADRVVLFLQTPLNRAIADYSLARATEELKARHGGVVPPEALPLLRAGNIVPRRVQVDPGQLVRILSAVSPNWHAEVRIEPYRFSPADVPIDAVADVATALIGENGAPDANTQAQRRVLYARLSENQQAELRRLADIASPIDADRDVLLDLLNALVESGSLAEEAAFGPLFAPPARSWVNWFSKAAPNPLVELKSAFAGDSVAARDGQRRLNRLLVWHPVQQYLPPPGLALAELEIWEPISVNTQSLAAAEGFMIWMKAGLITGLFLASPWIFFQLWTFVAAGLYPHEQRYVYVYMPMSILLFVAGAALAFFFVFDPVLGFLFQFNARMGIEIQPRIGDWLTFVMFMPLGFGIAFQLPLVMLILSWLGVFTVRAYLEKWRVAVLVVFFLSMVLTPAEPISMMMMAVPLTLLYFLGIGLCYWMPRRHSPFGEGSEP